MSRKTEFTPVYKNMSKAYANYRAQLSAARAGLRRTKALLIQAGRAQKDNTATCLRSRNAYGAALAVVRGLNEKWDTYVRGIEDAVDQWTNETL